MTEMHWICHYDNGPGNPDIATGVVEQNILTRHDNENLGNYPPGHEGADGPPADPVRRVHSSNALGLPGAGGLPSPVGVMHGKHKEIVPDTMVGCYNCHPGPQTQCLRDAM